MTPIARLLAAVEAENVTTSIVREAFPPNGKDSPVFLIRAALADKDTDAAIALCGAMLPDGGGNGGSSWSISLVLDRNDHTGAAIWTANVHDGSSHTCCDIDEEAIADNPARALTIALLRALVALEGTP